jgi:hypothetical protein
LKLALRNRVGHLHHVQVGELVEVVRVGVLRLEHLGELVVGHRRGGVDLAVQEEVHVEGLRDDVHVLLRVEAVLGQRGEELVLVPAEPDTDLLALQLLDVRDAAVGPRDLRHPGAGEDLGDVDDLTALVACREQVVEPVDAEVRLAAEHGLLGDDVRPAHLDVDVEVLVVVVALLESGVVAGELRLRHPLELERDLGRLLGGTRRGASASAARFLVVPAACGEAKCQRGGEAGQQCPFPHVLPSPFGLCPQISVPRPTACDLSATRSTPATAA